MLSVAGQDGSQYFDTQGKRIHKQREVREPAPENDKYNFFFAVDPCMLTFTTEGFEGDDNYTN